MAKVFLDIGAHTGQTLAAVKRWDFDRIVCFEPVQAHIPALEKLADSRTEIKNFGLWDRNAQQPIYEPGSQGASLWKRPNRPETSAVCHFVSAAEWIRENIAHGDRLWVKMNCEGAELDILTDLLDSGEFERIDFIQIMWDARKIPAIAGRMAEVKARIDAKYRPPRVVDSRDVPNTETYTARTDSWLSMTSAERLP